MIKVTGARFHLGVQLGAMVKTGLDATIDETTMELDPLEGLYITKIKGKVVAKPIFVPLGMLNMCYLEPDSLAEHRKALKAEKKK